MPHMPKQSAIAAILGDSRSVGKREDASQNRASEDESKIAMIGEPVRNDGCMNLLVILHLDRSCGPCSS